MSSFRSLRTGSHDVCSPHVVSLCDFAYYVDNLWLLCILPFRILCPSALRIMFVKTRSRAINIAFISSTTLLCLPIHVNIVPDISTSWYKYSFSFS